MATTKDPLIGRTVRVLPGATTFKGQPHPQAGQQGTVEGRTPGGVQRLGRQRAIRDGRVAVQVSIDGGSHAGILVFCVVRCWSRRPRVAGVHLLDGRAPNNRPVVFLRTMRAFWRSGCAGWGLAGRSND